MNSYAIIIIVLFITYIIYYQFGTKPKLCPNCNQPLPEWRIPRSPREMFLGGWTCSHCGSYVEINIFKKPRLTLNKKKQPSATTGVILFSAPTIVGVTAIITAKVFRPGNAMPLCTTTDRFFAELVIWGYPISLLGLPFVVLAVILGIKVIVKEGLGSKTGKVALLSLVATLGATGYIINLIWSL